MDYKIIQLVTTSDIVITQDYGLASLLLKKARIIMHHKGFIYNENNIDILLQHVIIMHKLENKVDVIKDPPFFKSRPTIFVMFFKPYLIN